MVLFRHKHIKDTFATMGTYLQQIENHIHAFFRAAKLTNKKWYKEIHTTDELIYAFFVIRRRMIQPKCYAIHEAKSIHDREIKPDVLREYENLKFILENKGDLKKYHTENSKILFPIDGLLEDWSINHLHMDRSRFQVFFVQDGKELFVINICKHFERNRTGYNKAHLLQTMEENWPEKFQKNKQRHAKISEKYPSSYGWKMTDKLHTWLNEIPSIVAASEAEIIFVENERFSIRSKSGEAIVNLPDFEV